MMRNRERPPTRRETRARQTINSDRKMAQRASGGLPERPRELASFTVQRCIDGGNSQNHLLANPYIHQLIGSNQTREGARHSFVLSSLLLSQGDTSYIMGETGKTLQAITTVAETVVAELPSQLEGAIGGVYIAGVKPSQKGRRYVSLFFRDSLSKTLSQERQYLLGQLGAEKLLRRGRNPHLTVYQTTDQMEAEQVTENLKQQNLVGSPIMLESAEVIPVKWQPLAPHTKLRS